jgi:hypothetical protein
MTWRLDAWDRFAHAGFWWMHAMVALWSIFALMLSIVEPVFLHRRLGAALNSDGSSHLFDRMERFHRIVLALSLVTILGAVGGIHGL